MTDPSLQRAQLLYQQRRYDLAAEACREALAQSPENPFAHALLGLCFLQQKKYDEATAEAGVAIHQAPDSGYCHYVAGVIFQERNRFDEAEAAAREALHWNPEDPDFWSLLAQICLSRQRWEEMLDAANRGLQFDPEHNTCINLRAMALVKLGEKQAAAQTIAEALRKNPHSALSHANQGWTLLHQNQHKPAMEHFREALRIDPTSQWAREGMMAALKARYFIYRWMLRYYLWMSRFGKRGQWGVILGLWLASQVLRIVKGFRPELAPVIYPLIIAYGVFVIGSWLADPIFNLTLLINRFGRYLLSRLQRATAMAVGALLVAGIGLVVAGLAMQDDPTLLLGLHLGLLTLPTAATSRCPPGKVLTVMAIYTALLAVIGVVGIVIVSSGNEQGLTIMLIAVWGSVLSSLAANIIGSVVIRR